MFEHFKKIFAPAVTVATVPDMPDMPDNETSRWATAQGFSYKSVDSGFVVAGQVDNRSWKLECAKSSRDYIHGDELRARADLKINEDVSVLIMNRPLKEALEKRAYEMYTDTLQTIANPNLPEEMRWLAMYPEVSWIASPPALWSRYCVLADHREHALTWLDNAFMSSMLSWPHPGPDDQVPFILMLLRGKIYLRMQFSPADMSTTEHAVRIFTLASASAVKGFTVDVSI